MRKKRKFQLFKNISFFVIGVGLIVVGIFIIWASTLQLPDFKSLSDRKIQSSTKIYDRTGKILLYDIHQNIKRTVIPYEKMGTNILNATVAIEDSDFYNHSGIRITSIIRATIWAKLTGRRIQGGSTITQQLVKNTLLTSRVSITRKIKEWILSLKLEKVMSKKEILTLYLNEIPYGGNIYGIDEAAKSFFNKNPINLTLPEAAYLAAIPNAPTYYSPYGKHLKELVDRKNLVLKRMLDIKFITQDVYNKAVKEKVAFSLEQPVNIAAPHFVFFVKKYLEKKYGVSAVEEGGLKVITTLDYDLQKKAEEIVLAGSKKNAKKYNGNNAAAVIIDPKTGQILAMVGSRDYFDKKIDGNFNVATALRQPGSSFKPIVYAEAIRDGYTDKTTLFDVPTEFNSSCDPQGFPLPNIKNATCYMPTDFNTKYRGPMTLRNALAQSINIVAVKLLYLVGVQNSIKMAHNLGITSLNDPGRYGLSLVIGGGETSLLDMTSVYGVFANNGIRNPYQDILSVTDSNGNILEKYQNKAYKVLSPKVAETISSILSDNKARTPTFGPNSILNIGKNVAVKTGTTNKDKDAWTIGYTPNVAVGVWVGNNNDTSMRGGGSTLAGPIWNGIMKEAIKKYPGGVFNKPNPINPKLPPVIRGFWQGGETFLIDKISGGLATKYTPQDLIKEISITNVHNILYWINKADPLGPEPSKTRDSLYNNWEYSVNNWWQQNKEKYKIVTQQDKPTYFDNIHTLNNKPTFKITGINNNTIYKKDDLIPILIEPQNQNLIKKIDIFINDTYLTSLRTPPFKTSFKPEDITNISTHNVIHIIGYDVLDNEGETTLRFNVIN